MKTCTSRPVGSNNGSRCAGRTGRIRCCFAYMAVRAVRGFHLTMVFAPWEQEFTDVQWDQRATGKTLEATGASITGSMTVERMADDGIEVSEFVRNHLHKDKIVLLGFSWGSILGIHMIQKRPDLFFPICRN